ncbi:MAG: LysM peptidoglycan-binding domain-containing protein [Anaerolineales bacterium]|nr:LysM peptidoglycan-binding domain-containing protein [Anaerolineales bacterium]
MRTLLRWLSLASLFLISAAPAYAPAPQGSPSEVVALINAYRAEFGLPPYEENPLLYQLAQGQADYLASTQGATGGDIHTGPGGTRPRDRAYAAGYGGGSTIFISEIAKYGMGETSQSAINWWKQSPNHNPTMIASTYIHIGCGVANDGTTRYYFVCVTGYSAGGVPSTGSGTPAVSGGQGSQPPVQIMIPVTKAEPQPDGSIMHIIRTGQTLWTVAAVYEVPLEQLLELNGFTEWEVLHPGDEVMVAPPGSVATSVPTKDPNATPTATATLSPTPTATATVLSAADTDATVQAALALAQQEVQQANEQRTANSSVQLVVGIAMISILSVVVASFFIQRPATEPEPDENDPFAPIT